MIKRNGYFLAAILFGLSVMTACSKNLMPPEGLDGTTSVGSPMSSSSQFQDSDSGSAGSGFNIREQGNGRGFAEENGGESAMSGGFSTGGSDGSGSDG